MVQITIEQALKIGMDHHQAGRFPEAENAYRQILAVEPNHWHALLLLGLLAHRVGQQDAALKLINQSIAIKPDCADSHYNLGEVYRTRGDLELAIAEYIEAIRLRPGMLIAYEILAGALRARGRLEEAIKVAQQAIEALPGAVEPYMLLSDSLMQQGRHEKAVAANLRALQIKPDFVRAHFNLGNAYFAQEKHDLALAAFLRARELDPNLARTHHNVGECLRMLGNYPEALASIDRGLALDPNHPQSHLNRGNTLAALGRWEEAIAELREALRIRPDYMEVHWNLASALLLTGRMAEGWEEFEYRLKIPSRKLNRGFSQPQWDGSDPAGKTILLHTEGGFGDAIQFVRLVPMLQGRGAKLILECQPSLVTLFLDVPGIDQIVPRGKTLPPFDWQIPLQGLPRILGITLENIPNAVPYLAAPPDRVAAWAKRLAPYKKRKVGLVWAGTMYAPGVEIRSRSADIFLPIARVKGVQFFSLQKGPGAAEKPPAEMNVIDFTSDLHDWADTAAYVENLDLVISVDTSVAHLAGALAKPVWVILPKFNDFRWLLERTDSPWYPTMRLFRQQTVENWNDMIEEIALQLADLPAI